MITNILDLAIVPTPIFDSAVALIGTATGYDIDKASWFVARATRYVSAEEERRSYDQTRGYVAIRAGKIAMDPDLAAVVEALGIITPELEAALAAEWARVAPTLPRPTIAPFAAVQDLRRDLGSQSKDLYAMLTTDRTAVVMCQLRVDKANGKKVYYPHSYISSPQLGGRWIRAEPWCMPDSIPDKDGVFPEFKLPFWKPAKRRDLPKIMMHEGAKTAWFVDNLVNNNNPEWEARRRIYPPAWLKYFKGFEHWGIIGGARSPHRSNYRELQSMCAELVVYVCDRDPPGEAAVRDFSRLYQRRLDYVKFSEDIFPMGFDLADDLPAALFHDGVCTTAIESFLNPGTWATELIVAKAKGQKAVYDITADFLADWRYVQMPGLFAHERFPNVTYDMDEFNLKMLAHSHVGKKTGDLFLTHIESQIPLITYDPSKLPGSIKMVHETKGHSVGFNTYVKSRIEPHEHEDIWLWFEFMEHLFPNENDRIEVYRWIYTLLVHPAVRIGYGLLLYSQTQGVGKTMLFEHILQPLLGYENTSSVREDDVFGSFTSWRHNKRLAYINEIHNKNGTDKMYNFLKEVITDRLYLHNEKHRPAFNQDSWLHVMASSNNDKALKLDKTDRRWLIPKVAEMALNRGFAARFVAWLQGPGLSAILAHAHAWFTLDGADAIVPGAHAPDTSARAAMIEASLSPGQRLVKDCIEALLEKYPPDQHFSVTIGDVVLIDLIHRRLYLGGQSTNFLEKAKTVREIVGDGWHWGAARQFFTRLGYKGNIKGLVGSNHHGMANMTPKDLELLQGPGIKIFLSGEDIEHDLGVDGL